MQLYRPPVLRRWENQRMLSSFNYCIKTEGFLEVTSSQRHSKSSNIYETVQDRDVDIATDH